MNYVTGEILNEIFQKIKIKTRIKYLSYGDGEQNMSVFYKELYPYNIVCRSWKQYFNK